MSVLFTSTLLMYISYRCGWAGRSTNFANVGNVYEQLPTGKITEVHARTQRQENQPKKGTVNLSIDNFPSSNTKRNGGHNIKLLHTLAVNFQPKRPLLTCLLAQCDRDSAAERFDTILLIAEPLFMGDFHFEKYEHDT